MSDRRLTDAERERLREGLFATIDREQGQGRQRRRVTAGVVLLAVLAAMVAGVALHQPGGGTAGVVDAIPVRCGADDVAAADATITAQGGRDPRLVCSELWRRGELVGGRRKASELTACAQVGDGGVLVLVSPAPGESCRNTGA